MVSQAIDAINGLKMAVEANTVATLDCADKLWFIRCALNEEGEMKVRVMP